MDLYTALGVMAATAVLFAVCYIQDHKPVDVAKPRMLPYRLIMMVLIVAFLAMAAHVISLLTGHPIVPRRKFGL
ncbi:MAG: hypothetical protein K2P94_11485 [Rhodospirillaceae bacterium]|nr:hypothetical protein [Rhodospirillaceae bacterium]